MIKPSEVTGALIMGGQAKRFGGNKAFADWDGMPMYARSYAVLMEIAEKVIIVGSKDNTNQLLARPLDIILEDSDDFAGNGPLAGLFTAIKNGQSDWYAVMPCDTPLINKDVFLKMFDIINEEINEGKRPDAVIPIVGGKKQPLVGMYHHSILPLIKDLLESQKFKMAFLLDTIDSCYFDPSVQGISDNRFMNINTRSEFSRLKEKFGIE